MSQPTRPATPIPLSTNPPRLQLNEVVVSPQATAMNVELQAQAEEKGREASSAGSEDSEVTYNLVNINPASIPILPVSMEELQRQLAEELAETQRKQERI